MLTPQRAAANSVRLIFSLLIAHSQRELVNKVCADTDLVVHAIISPHLLHVGLPDAVNRVTESASFLIFEHVRIALDTRFSRKLNVLAHEEARAFISEGGEPCAFRIGYHALPRVTYEVASWDRRFLPNVYCDILRDNSILELARMRMLTTTPKDSRCLHTSVANSLYVSIKESVSELGLESRLCLLLDFLLFGSSSSTLFFCPFDLLLDMFEIKIIKTVSTNFLWE